VLNVVKKGPGKYLPVLFKQHEIWPIDFLENKCQIIALRCQILRLTCTTFDFGWGYAPDPDGETYSTPPDPIAGFQAAVSWQGGEGREREGEREWVR